MSWLRNMGISSKAVLQVFIYCQVTRGLFHVDYTHM
jgi:hypothetical protein